MDFRTLLGREAGARGGSSDGGREHGDHGRRAGHGRDDTGPVSGRRRGGQCDGGLECVALNPCVDWPFKSAGVEQIRSPFARSITALHAIQHLLSCADFVVLAFGARIVHIMKSLSIVEPTPEQTSILTATRPGTVVIRGAAGSGKTTTALLRLKFLVAYWVAGPRASPSSASTRPRCEWVGGIRSRRGRGRTFGSRTDKQQAREADYYETHGRGRAGPPAHSVLGRRSNPTRLRVSGGSRSDPLGARRELDPMTARYRTTPAGDRP